MKRANLIAVFLAAIWVLSPLVPAAYSAPIDDLIAGAKTKSALELCAASTLTPKGVQRLGEAFVQGKENHLHETGARQDGRSAHGGARNLRLA